MKVALVDDEDAVRETVKTILLHYYPDIKIKEVTGVEEGLMKIPEFDPDLIFLDIEMGDGTGFDILTRMSEVRCPVVFVTAHDHYAVKAFKFSALDYILKPVDPKEIVTAFEKAKNEVTASNQKKLDLLLDNHKNDSFMDIVLCQAVGNYTHFFLIDGREIIISKTLKHYDDLLGESDFVRIHQSYLINLHHLDLLNKRDGGEVVMKNGSVIPISTRKKETLVDVLKKFKS